MKRKRLSSARRKAAAKINILLTNRMARHHMTSAEYQKLDKRLARLQNATRYR
jgi:hypothetical protein